MLIQNNNYILFNTYRYKYRNLLPFFMICLIFNGGYLNCEKTKEQNMSASKLEKQLFEDTNLEVPPFGAESIKIAHKMGSEATNTLLTQIKKNGKTAFLALEALRASDNETYNSLSVPQKAEIYINNLQHSTFYNAWGVPGYQLTGTSNALISMGEAIIPFLSPLLENKLPALLSGSQDATTSSIYKNRICDYAWIFIIEIKHRQYSYHKTPEERDEDIRKLLLELGVKQ